MHSINFTVKYLLLTLWATPDLLILPFQAVLCKAIDSLKRTPSEN